MPLIRTTTAELVTADLAVPLATETVVVTSDALQLPAGTLDVLVSAWCQLTTGGGTTTVTSRIRRGALVTDPLVGEGNAEQLKAAAGSIEPFDIMVVDQLVGGGSVRYSYTLTLAGAAGTFRQGSISVSAIR